MKRVVCIALKHPTEPGLFLHGLRTDNKLWTLPGGHVNPGETLIEAAKRELQEEAGISHTNLRPIHASTYGDTHVTLFHGDFPQQQLSNKKDPDHEFVTYKWLDPRTHSNLHIPKERNILVDWMDNNLLEKMSRPQISFPKLGVTTRPDQEVQLAETERQKKMYGLKVVQPMKDPDTRQANAKRLSGYLGRGTVGLVAGSKLKAPKAVSLAGKLRSKFEESPEYEEKLSNYADKRNAMVSEYNNKYKDWQAMAYKLSNDTSPEGIAALEAHKKTKPVQPKLPRKPSRKLLDTKKLNREQMAARGKSIDSTIAHEGFHYVMAKIAAKHGDHAAERVKKSLLAQFAPTALAAVGGFINSVYNYKTRDPGFTEEMLAHSRDILVNPKKREKFKEFIGNNETFSQHIRDLKIGHQKAYDYAQKVTPADFQTGTEKLAASEKYHDQLSGGLADKKKPSDFDKEKLKEGIRVEMEHTNDPQIALEIAMDHLTEDSEYYSKLKTLEKSQHRIVVEPFTVSPENFNPTKHDFIVRYMHGNEKIGFVAVTHKKHGILPFNMEVEENHRRKGYATAMCDTAQEIAKKPILASPDMTDDSKKFFHYYFNRNKA